MKILRKIWVVLASGGFCTNPEDYEELREMRIRENWEIMQRKDKSLGAILQKIGVMISTGGFIIKPKGES